jgi:hypothetical protein
MGHTFYTVHLDIKTIFHNKHFSDNRIGKELGFVDSCIATWPNRVFNAWKLLSRPSNESFLQLFLMCFLCSLLNFVEENATHRNVYVPEKLVNNLGPFEIRIRFPMRNMNKFCNLYMSLYPFGKKGLFQKIIFGFISQRDLCFHITPLSCVCFLNHVQLYVERQ